MNAKKYSLYALFVLCVSLLPSTAHANKTHYVWITRHESTAAYRTSIGYTCNWREERKRFICKKPITPVTGKLAPEDVLVSHITPAPGRDSPALDPNPILADVSAFAASIENDITERNLRVFRETLKLPSLSYIKTEAELNALGELAPGIFYGRFMPPMDTWQPRLLYRSSRSKLFAWTSKYPHETKVTASAGGKVLVAGWFENLGWTIIVNHAQGLSTLYTGHHGNLVKKDQLVGQGTPIALLAEQGGPECHDGATAHTTRWTPIRWYAIRGGKLIYKPLSFKSVRMFASHDLKKIMRLQQ